MNSDKRKLVAHLTGSLGCGGLEMVIVNLVSQSKSVDHVIISLTDDISLKSRLPDHVKIYCLHKKPGKDLGCHARVYELIKELSPDVLQTYNFPAMEYHWVSKLAGVKKLIHAEHGYGGEHPEGKDWHKNLFRKITSSLWDDYIVVSEDLKSWAINTVKVRSSLVSVVYNGVPVPKTPPGYQSRKPSASKPFNLVTVGRLADIKNQPQLVEAIGIAKKNHPDKHIHLHIVGEGEMRGEIENKIEELSLSNEVTLHGLQNDIPKFLKDADAFVLSSLYEAMPMTVLEAMSQNRPVICPKVGGVTDFISDDEALLITGNDVQALSSAICKMYDMPYKERSELSLRGFDRAQKEYSVENMTEVYESKYMN